MNKKNLFLKILGILFSILIVFFTVNRLVIKADSGFDSGYDGGGWDSGSDWGGSSDWGGGSDYGSGGGGGDPVATLVFLIIIIIVIIISVKSSKTRITKPPISKEYIGDIPIPGFDKQVFLNEAYETYLKVQVAWMDFDYDTLRELLTDELFNSYKSQLKTLSLKKQKNIMNSFVLGSHFINNFSESEKEYTIKTELQVSFIDYIANEKNKVLRGSKSVKINMTYELTFVKSKSTKENKCPNCNAPLKSNQTSNVCPYCKSTIVGNTHGWILAKKEVKRQL